MVLVQKVIQFFANLHLIHHWEYTPAEYYDKLDEKLAVPKRKATRVCSRCGKKQEEDRYCLGLNPPKYGSIWDDV